MGIKTDLKVSKISTFNKGSSVDHMHATSRETDV